MPATKKRKVAQEAPADDSDVSSNASEGAPQAEADTEAAEPAAKKSFKELGIIDSLCEACETMGLSTYNVLIDLLLSHLQQVIRHLQQFNPSRSH